MRINKYIFKNWATGKSKINQIGRERLRDLKSSGNTDIRFTAQKKVNGAWVTTDIPLDIQNMVLDAYKEIEEDSKEVGPLHHLAEAEKRVALYAMINNTEEVWDNELNNWVRPQLQEDKFIPYSPDDLCVDYLAEKQRKEEGYQRLYKAIMEVGNEKNYKCRMGESSCNCFMWEERADCDNWEEQVEDTTECPELTHEQKLACKNEISQCDDWPFCECDEEDNKIPGFTHITYNSVVTDKDLDSEDPVYMKDGVIHKAFPTTERTYSIFDYSGTNPVAIRPTNETILQEAQRLVHGDRGNNYGHPLDDMSRTALIWQAILGVAVTAEQVALCMVGVKISRECNKSQRDNATDGAGYFECLSMINEERKRRG